MSKEGIDSVSIPAEGLYLLNVVLLGATAVAFPLWSTYRSIDYTQDMVIGIVLGTL